MDDLSRRLLLRAIAVTLGAASLPSLPSNWLDIAHAAVPSPAPDEKFSFFTVSDAADVEAVAAQIVPTDDTPGAREAGVIHFIDRALATFLSQLASDYRAQLADSRGRSASGLPRRTRPRRPSRRSLPIDRLHS